MIDFNKLTPKGQSCWPAFRTGGLNKYDHTVLEYAVCRSGSLEQSSKLILLEILRFQGHRSKSWPSQQTLRGYLSMSEATLRRGLLELHRVRLLCRQRRRKDPTTKKSKKRGSRGNLYQVQPPLDVFTADYLKAMLANDYWAPDWSSKATFLCDGRE